MYDCAAQASFADVKNNQLTRRYSFLACVELNLDPVVIQRCYNAGLIGLPVTDLCMTAQAICKPGGRDADPA